MTIRKMSVNVTVILYVIPWLYQKVSFQATTTIPKKFSRATWVKASPKGIRRYIYPCVQSVRLRELIWVLGATVTSTIAIIPERITQPRPHLAFISQADERLRLSTEILWAFRCPTVWAMLICIYPIESLVMRAFTKSFLVSTMRIDWQFCFFIVLFFFTFV